LVESTTLITTISSFGCSSKRDKATFSAGDVGYSSAGIIGGYYMDAGKTRKNYTLSNIRITN